MPFEKAEIKGGDEVWNVADGYTKLKILKPMFDCDKFENIAQYGIEDMNDELHLIITDDMKANRRVDALRRFKNVLSMLISNVSFIIKKNDRESLQELRNDLIELNPFIHAVANEVEDQVAHTKRLEIDEEFFGVVLNELKRIKEELNVPINRAGLIFKTTEDIDLDEMQRQIEEGG